MVLVVTLVVTFAWKFVYLSFAYMFVINFYIFNIIDMKLLFKSYAVVLISLLCVCVNYRARKPAPAQIPQTSLTVLVQVRHTFKFPVRKYIR